MERRKKGKPLLKDTFFLSFFLSFPLISTKSNQNKRKYQSSSKRMSNYANVKETISFCLSITIFWTIYTTKTVLVIGYFANDKIGEKFAFKNSAEMRF